MTNHALAFVKWEVFRKRSRERRPERSFFYACPQKQLTERIGNGGTLWVITRRPHCQHYSLAYKLVNCRSWTDVPTDISREYGKNLVVSENWDACEHYPFNDVTGHLLRLHFKTGKTLLECKPRGHGRKILTIPELQPSSARILESFALNLMSQRVVFLSYPREDITHARRLVREMEERDIKVDWDQNLVPSTRWRESLEVSVRASDIFAVLVSDHSPKSDWVRREIGWAKEEIEKGGCVEHILPIRMSEAGWKKIRKIHEFEYFDCPTRPNRRDFDRLSRMIVTLPRRRKAGWE